MPNFSFLAGLEVAEKFVVEGGVGGWCVEHVTTMNVILELLCMFNYLIITF